MKYVLILALGFAVVPACVCVGGDASETPEAPKPMGSHSLKPRGRVPMLRNMPILPPRTSGSAAASGAASAAPSAQ